MTNENPINQLSNNSPTEQIPARMVNEFSYCPRLFYLEFVQKEWAESAETLDGSFVHRRVDIETGKLPTDGEAIEENLTLHARSVWLGSENLGISAKIDVLESGGRIATPIDYKRGAPPDVAEGAYEPERVQLCLQALLLRENGFECVESFLYFAESQQKVRIEITPALIIRAVELLAQAIRELASREIPIVHLSYGGWLNAVTTSPPHKNIELRRAQFSASMDKEKCLTLARSFVAGKIYNQRTLLRRNAKELPNESLVFLREMRRKSANAANLQELLGMEGAAAREYFSKFTLLFKQQNARTTFDFTTRNRRPPRDPVNALLSFLYSMLTKEMLVCLIGIGFDPYLGFYHQPRYGRPALALDLMEEFRSLVADSVVIGLINNGEIRPQDFIQRLSGCALTDAGRKRVIEAFERRLNTTITHPIFGYTVSYRRIFEIQARLLARYLTGEIPVYPSFITR